MEVATKASTLKHLVTDFILTLVLVQCFISGTAASLNSHKTRFFFVWFFFFLSYYIMGQQELLVPGNPLY